MHMLTKRSAVGLVGVVVMIACGPESGDEGAYAASTYDATTDDCDTTGECRLLYGPKATDCLGSKKPNSICMCGSEPCGGAAPSCNDGVKNQNEAGVDCGGSCRPCPASPGEDECDTTTECGGIYGGSGRPRVFLAMHGSNELANNASNDAKWSYVRQNLDGLWGNNNGMSVDELARMWYKVKTRTLIKEMALPEDTTQDLATAKGLVVALQNKYPDIVLNREAVALYASETQRWDGRTIADMEKLYVTSDPAYSFKKIYTGWGSSSWVDPNWSHPAAAKVATPITGDGAIAVQEADGMFMEVSVVNASRESGVLAMALERAIRTMHAANKPFIWFTSPTGKATDNTGALANFKASYQILASKGLWRTDDVVMIINYRGAYPMVPETINGQPADTVTGMLYWALQQR